MEYDYEDDLYDEDEEEREIWRERLQIEEARRQKLHEAMEEYDHTVFHPAMKSLRERCAEIGHKRGRFHDNGIGWTWWYCNQCGGRMEIESYSDSASPNQTSTGD